MQNTHEQLQQLQKVLENLIQEHKSLESVIREEEFAFELKKKNLYEVVSNSITKNVEKTNDFQELRMPEIQVAEEKIHLTLQTLLNL